MTARTLEDLQQNMEFLSRQKCTAVVRTNSTQKARAAAEAAIRGGISSIEFTLSIPGCVELIAEFAQRPGLIVGGGTVLNTKDAEDIVNAGGKFIVSPIFEPSVVEWCAIRNVVCMAGVYSPSEMWQAHKLGAHIVKLFPGAAGGPAFVKAVRGPLPFLKIVPTTGVTEENCAEYMKVGSFGVGFTGVLFDPEDMEKERWDVIEERARRFSNKVRGATSRL